jgi:hypothetical protein
VIQVKITFPSFEAYGYVQVFKVLEWKDGAVFRTEHKGYAKVDRPAEKDEIYVPLSTKLMKQPEITLELLD